MPPELRNRIYRLVLCGRVLQIDVNTNPITKRLTAYHRVERAHKLSRADELLQPSTSIKAIVNSTVDMEASYHLEDNKATASW